MVHFELNRREEMALSVSRRDGSQGDRPWMLCRTGDGHAVGTRVWDSVNCPRCLETAKTWRKYNNC